MMIPRLKLQELIAWIDEPEVLVVLGPRQVGKTTLLKQLKKWLIKKHRVSQNKIHFYNLDLDRDKKLLASQDQLLDELGDLSKKQYVFIDEVQRIKESGLFIKGLVDRFPQIKFVLSGSSSLEIRSKVGEVLTGRKHLVFLRPLSIMELPRKRETIKSLLQFGGYPLVYSTRDRLKKIARLEEIITSYIDQDIHDFLGIELLDSYRKLLVLLANGTGQLLNVSFLSKKLNLHYQTVEKYLSILQQTFLIDLIYPFASKPSQEIVKSPIPYFLDTGLRNAVMTNFNDLENRHDAGFLFENLIYREIKEVLPPTMVVNFWRTKSQQEVDFIISNRLNALPVEVKYSKLSHPEVTSSMKLFIDKYQPEQMFVVNLELNEDRRWGSAIIKYRNPWLFVEELAKELGG